MRTERRDNTALPPRLGRHTACTNNPAAPPCPPKVIFLPLLLHLSRVSLSPNHRKRFDCAADGGGGAWLFRAEAPGVGGRRSVCRCSRDPDPETQSARKKGTSGHRAAVVSVGFFLVLESGSVHPSVSECFFPHGSFARVLAFPSPGM